MTDNNKELLIHMFSGGKIQQQLNDFTVYTVKSITLTTSDGTNVIKIPEYITTENYSIHYSEEELKNQRLQEVIAVQQEEINRLNKVIKNSKSKTPYKRLTPKEVEDIHKDIKFFLRTNGTVEVNALASSYSISVSRAYKYVKEVKGWSTLDNTEETSY